MSREAGKKEKKSGNEKKSHETTRLYATSFSSFQIYHCNPLALVKRNFFFVITKLLLHTPLLSITKFTHQAPSSWQANMRRRVDELIQTRK
jgi:hypothetical protein